MAKKIQKIKHWHPDGYWRRTYKGVLLTASLKQLGCKTREESIVPFKEWFSEQVQKIDNGTLVPNRKRIQKKVEEFKCPHLGHPKLSALSAKFTRLAHAAGQIGVGTQDDMLKEANALGLINNKKITVLQWFHRSKEHTVVSWEFSSAGNIYTPEFLKIVYESCPRGLRLSKVECRTINK